MLIKKFKKITNGQKMWPTINNWSPFVGSTKFNDKLFLGSFYKNKTEIPAVVIGKIGEGLYLMPETKVFEIHSEVFKEFFLNPQKIQRRLRKFNQYAKKIEKIYSKLSYDYIRNEKFSRLLEYFEELRLLTWSLNGIAWFSITPLDKELCLKELKKIKINISSFELDSIWEKGTYPFFDSFDKDQESHILRLIARGKKWKDIVEECQYFFSSYFNSKSLAAADELLRENFKNIYNNKKAINKLKVDNKIKKEKIRELKSWLPELNIRQRKLVKYFQLIMGLRDKRKNLFLKAITVWFRIAEKLFDEAGVDKNLIPLYTHDELKKGARYLKNNADSLKKRKNGFVILINYNGRAKTELADFNKSKTELNKYYYKTISQDGSFSKKEIKGQIGSAGLVKGIVKVVLDPNKFHEFKKGNILVAGMTRPEYVPLMKKAAAIITDEGGITCHAAIVSRELKKPCIIGTKIATQVLHDGDFVEVNANKGVVKILKKKK